MHTKNTLAGTLSHTHTQRKTHPQTQTQHTETHTQKQWGYMLVRDIFISYILCIENCCKMTCVIFVQSDRTTLVHIWLFDM